MGHDRGVLGGARTTSHHSRHSPSPVQMKLIFYPSDHWLIVYKLHKTPGGDSTFEMVAKVEVWGGTKSITGDEGGHSRGPTVRGHYILGKPRAYTTRSWPASVIPWGAVLRENDKTGEIEYLPEGDSHWKVATGATGEVTKSQYWFAAKTAAGKDWRNVPYPTVVSDKKYVDWVRDEVKKEWFYPAQAENRDRPVYVWNNFGPLAWPILHLDGTSTGMFIHTTPENEEQSKEQEKFKKKDISDSPMPEVKLESSHGCLHIRPKDRDIWKDNHWLRAGIRLDVKPYSEHFKSHSHSSDYKL